MSIIPEISKTDFSICHHCRNFIKKGDLRGRNEQGYFFCWRCYPDKAQELIEETFDGIKSYKKWLSDNRYRLILEEI